jgi:hypothetical protein
VPSRYGLVAFIAVLAGGLLLGETFPFSRFSMYANVGRRTESAVPVFLADGVVTEPSRYERFQGLELSRVLLQKTQPSSLQYKTDDGYRWISRHVAQDGERAGPVRFAAGYVTVRLSPAGELTHETHILTEGHAWSR